eukprot:COSAG06_NODE_897_length_11651_cov_7.190439_7_plen_190_part_00
MRCLRADSVPAAIRSPRRQTRCLRVACERRESAAAAAAAAAMVVAVAVVAKQQQPHKLLLARHRVPVALAPGRALPPALAMGKALTCGVADRVSEGVCRRRVSREVRAHQEAGRREQVRRFGGDVASAVGWRKRRFWPRAHSVFLFRAVPCGIDFVRSHLGSKGGSCRDLSIFLSSTKSQGASLSTSST